MSYYQKEAVIREYLQGGISCRKLAKKYGISHATIARWVKSVIAPYEQKLKWEKPVIEQVTTQPLPNDVEQLQEELRKAQLHNKLLNAMLDIGKEQYGIDLRKKAGTKRSRE